MRRLQVPEWRSFYVPIGVVRKKFFPGEEKAKIPRFTSSQDQIHRDRQLKPGLRPFEKLTPTQEPLESVREKVTFISGMDRFYKHGSDVHAQCASCFLSSATAHSVDASVYPLARTLDHLVADQIGDRTPFRTLELSCNSHQDNKESIYFDNISWYGTGYVAPSLRDPRRVYERLFGLADLKTSRNITDLVLEDAHEMRRELGVADREKFAEYFDAIRTLEQQMSRLEAMRDELAKSRGCRATRSSFTGAGNTSD